MKLLKIENSQGYFLGEDGEYATVEKITKEDLLRMVKATLSKEVAFDEYDSEGVRNPAQQIIYKSVYGKLSKLYERKDEFLDESERLYLQDYEKYKSETRRSEGESEDA